MPKWPVGHCKVYQPCIISLNGDERIESVERIFEGKITESFPNVRQNINIYIQRAQWTYRRINSETHT